jgi:hypothetical protein
VLDKDFAEIAAVSDVFDQATYYLCRVHVSKAVERFVDKMSLPRKQSSYKSQLKKSFDGMLLSRSEEEYLSHYQNIMQLPNRETQTDEVASELERAANYFEVNWHSIKEHWAIYILKSKPLFRTYTYNCVESFNGYVKYRTVKHVKVSTLVDILFDIAAEQSIKNLQRDWKSTKTTLLPGYALDDDDSDLLTRCRSLISHNIIPFLEVQLKLSREVKEEDVSMEKEQLSCPRLSGECEFYCTYLIPCKHLFFIRKHHREAMIVPAMINDK